MSSNNLRNNELEFTPTFGTQLLVIDLKRKNESTTNSIYTGNCTV